MNTTTQTTSALETALASARASAKKDITNLTPLENTLLGFDRDPNPGKFALAIKLCTKSFHETAMKRLAAKEAEKNGAPRELLDAIEEECEYEYDRASTLVEVLALYGHPFWN